MRVSEMRLDEWPLKALAATLDFGESHDEPFVFVPPLWHWLYFLPHPRRRELGADGHRADPARAGAEHRERRMFAAARTEFHCPLRTGAMAQITETTLRSRRVEGKTGPLRIVTLEYRYMQAGELCILEERDIIYLPMFVRGVPAMPAAMPSADARLSAQSVKVPDEIPTCPKDAAPIYSYSQRITPDAAMLFRFSALTFNAHRIHYDQTFARVEEGHAERVVHGPLTAILLAELLRQRGVAISRFEFRARRPLFVDAPIDLQATCADTRISLRAIGCDGQICMEATAWTSH
jgi:3-methylfumaryl-CoA hydratase